MAHVIIAPGKPKKDSIPTRQELQIFVISRHIIGITPTFQGIEAKDMAGKTMQRGDLRLFKIAQSDLNFFPQMFSGHMVA